MNRTLHPEYIEDAVKRIDRAYLDTPQLCNTSLDVVFSTELVLKVESLNPIRSFKGRGTDLFVAGLAGAPRLVCASAGNFGQGLARAGIKRGCPVTVFAAEGASPLKIEAMRRFGAEVRLAGQDFDAAKAAGRAFAADTGSLFVEDGADPAIAEGAGTIALEMTRSGVEVDAVLIPLGNGALATGMGA